MSEKWLYLNKDKEVPRVEVIIKQVFITYKNKLITFPNENLEINKKPGNAVKKCFLAFLTKDYFLELN